MASTDVAGLSFTNEVCYDIGTNCAMGTKVQMYKTLLLETINCGTKMSARPRNTSDGMESKLCSRKACSTVWQENIPP